MRGAAEAAARQRLLKQTRILVLAVVASSVPVVLAAQDLPRSAFLGVQLVPLADSQRAALSLPLGMGVLVRTTVAGGSAGASGVRSNDVILRVNDQAVATPDQVIALVRQLRPGTTATLLVHRGTDDLPITLSVRGRPKESVADIETLYQAVSVGDSLRRTLITVPRTTGAHPAILYLTGIGCFSQEDVAVAGTEAKLLYGLSRAGFVTMRVEKTGMGDSQGPPCASPESSLRREIAGYVAGLAALTRLPQVDSSRVFVMGLSIGGVEAPVVAAAVGVKGVVVINTVYTSFFEYLQTVRRQQMTLRDMPSDSLDRALELNEWCNRHLLIEKQRPAEILTQRPACKDYIDYPAPYTYMQEWADVNLRDAWKQVRAPVLVVYGTSDFVAIPEQAPLLGSLIERLHPGSVTLRPVEGMDHYLLRAKSKKESMYRSRETPGEFDTDVLDLVRDWLLSVSRTQSLDAR